MKGTMVIGLLTAIALITAGCETAGPKTATGALMGALIGAAAGGILGHQTGRHAGEGAGIGAALGAFSGALIGNEMESQNQTITAYPPNTVYYSQAPAYFSVSDIADMASRGLPDDVIIGEIQRTHSIYRLSSESITYLKQYRVSDRVIDYMLATGGIG